VVIFKIKWVGSGAGLSPLGKGKEKERE